MAMAIHPKTLIFLDDVRVLIPRGDFNNFIVCRSYDKCITVLNDKVKKNEDIYISLDHDLGEDKTGYDICKYIVENEIPLSGFTIHSQNGVGSQNMRQLMTHYGYKEFRYE